MADTTILFWGTQELGFTPVTLSNAVENTWNNDIDDIEMEIDADNDYDLSGVNPNDCYDLLEYLEDDSSITSRLQPYGQYDAVLIVDDRYVQGCQGIANTGSGGGQQAIGWIQSDSEDTATHEIGHIFGCSHDSYTYPWENDWQNVSGSSVQYSIMCTDDCEYYISCDANDPNFSRDIIYEDCEEQAIHDHFNI